MTVAPDRLFLFIGAGASLSAPSGRPIFNWIRDEVLHQLGLDSYVADTPDAQPKKVGVANALAPEPFMLELAHTAVAVRDWLEQVLGGGDPNAAHIALAALARKGAKIWTVNFDVLIERADPGLTSIAWPHEPSSGAAIMKPHGTLGAELIVTSQQVLRGLDDAWEQRLRRDVTGRTVVMLGYSGRDLDFQPLWDEVLANSECVLWFDRPDPAEQTRRRVLLRRTEAAGKLCFPPPAPFPPGLSAATTPNPSWDFVNWCRSEHLADPDHSLILRLFERVPPFAYPPLTGRLAAARPAVLGLLGDYRAARSAYVRLVRDPSERTFAVKSLVTLAAKQGGEPIAIGLALAKLIPPIGRLGSWKEAADRKRLTVLSKTGRHRAVLRGTKRIIPTTISTVLIVRSESTRITGSLDEAVDLAREARRRAVIEQHPVRVAHASFQQALALLWAERLDEALRCLDDDLVPYAAIAASRWIAWADFVRAGLAVRAGDGDAALTAYELSTARFAAERLMDGLVSVAVARLAALRLKRDDTTFLAAIAEVSEVASRGKKGQVFYAKAHRFTLESIQLERAEYHRTHVGALDVAERTYGSVANSKYPLHAAQARLGLAMIQVEQGVAPSRASEALALANRIGARLLADRAQTSLAATPGHRPAELYFC